MCQNRVESQESWYGEAEERDQNGPALVHVSGGTRGSVKGAWAKGLERWVRASPGGLRVSGSGSRALFSRQWEGIGLL